MNFELEEKQTTRFGLLAFLCTIKEVMSEEGIMMDGAAASTVLRSLIGWLLMV